MVSETGVNACGGTEKYVGKQQKNEWCQQVFVDYES
jgi:hypothetical protein